MVKISQTLCGRALGRVPVAMSDWRALGRGPVAASSWRVPVATSCWWALGRVPGLRGLLAVLLAAWLALSSDAAAAAPPTSWLADHIAFDIAGITGWRASFADERNPGFQILGGGGEVNLGLEFDSGLGVLVGSRAMFGPTLGAGGGELFADASGQLIGQLRVADWVRLGLGVSVGRLWRCCSSDLDTPQTSTLLAGGFARVGFDWLSRNANLVRALSFWLRLGIDGHPNNGSDSLLPTTSMNLTISIGFRL